jgi:hypothetical protein
MSPSTRFASHLYPAAPNTSDPILEQLPPYFVCFFQQRRTAHWLSPNHGTFALRDFHALRVKIYRR